MLPAPCAPLLLPAHPTRPLPLPLQHTVLNSNELTCLATHGPLAAAGSKNHVDVMDLRR
jgi:hypothetical protein